MTIRHILSRIIERKKDIFITQLQEVPCNDSIFGKEGKMWWRDGNCKPKACGMRNLKVIWC